jgi:hypothetical protein
LTRLPRAYQNRIDDALDGKSSVKLLLKAIEKLVYWENDVEWRHKAFGVEKSQKKEGKKKDEKKRGEKKNDWKKKEKGSTVNSFTTTTQQSSEQQKTDKGCYECGGQQLGGLQQVQGSSCQRASTKGKGRLCAHLLPLPDEARHGPVQVSAGVPCAGKRLPLLSQRTAAWGNGGKTEERRSRRDSN